MECNVRLIFRPTLARLLGLDESHRVLIRSCEPGESLADVLAKLAIEYPAVASRVFNSKERRINSLVQISINGRLIPLAGGVDALLREGDEVLFFSAAAGG